MLFPVLLVVGFHFSYGLQSTLDYQRQRTFNFRQYCTSQHSNSTYKVSCDGSKHFKDKNLFLDKRSASGITEIDLYSFENIIIVSQTSSDFEKIKRIAIRRSKKVIFKFQSILELNYLEIDSVDELALETETSDFSVEAHKMVLLNVGKLDFTFSNKADIKANVLNLTNIQDVNFYGNLCLAGTLLTISQSNVDLIEHSKLILRFSSVTVKEVTKLYIEESSELNVSTNYFLIQESYIYMNGQVNISDYEFLGSKNIIKFLNNSFYGMKRNYLHIFGDRNEVVFIGNGIYNSEISDVLDLAVETDSVSFTSNRFDCNKCAKRQTHQASHIKYLEHNFCDLTCNLTLTRYKELLDQDQVCSQGASQVEDKILCLPWQPVNIKKDLDLLKWTLLSVVVVSLLCISILLYFLCKKRHLPRLQKLPTESDMLPPKTQDSEVNQKMDLIAFGNEVYGREYVNDIYEVVD